MGQLAVKFKEWREKLELSHEKTKHGKYTFYLPFTVFNTSLMHNFTWSISFFEKYECFVELKVTTNELKLFSSSSEYMDRKAVYTVIQVKLDYS